MVLVFGAGGGLGVIGGGALGQYLYNIKKPVHAAVHGRRGSQRLAALPVRHQR